MKTLHFFFDPLSRDAQLAFARLPQLLEGVHHEVIHVPALLAPPKGQALLRLAFACGAPGLMPNRWVLEHILGHAAKGGDPDDPQQLRWLAVLLAPARDPKSPEVDAEVRAAHAEAMARGLTREPIVEVDGQRYVGEIGLALMSARLGGPG
jgi:hypothetical protein